MRRAFAAAAFAAALVAAAPAAAAVDPPDTLATPQTKVAAESTAAPLSGDDQRVHLRPDVLLGVQHSRPAGRSNLDRVHHLRDAGQLLARRPERRFRYGESQPSGQPEHTGEPGGSVG